MDNKGLIAFDYCLDNKSSETELFVWGSNTNYTLGLSSDREVQVPEPSYFYKKSLVVYKVKIEIFITGLKKNLRDDCDVIKSENLSNFAIFGILDKIAP